MPADIFPFRCCGDLVIPENGLTTEKLSKYGFEPDTYCSNGMKCRAEAAQSIDFSLFNPLHEKGL